MASEEIRKHVHICWRNMLIRCYNHNFTYYGNYGGRGVSVCDEWRNDFPAFLRWACGNGYQLGLTLDRIDVNGNYEPSNCRWVTMKVQNNNKRSNRLITMNGKTQTVSQWADELGLDYGVVRNRLHDGLPLEKAFADADLRTAPLITYHGKTQTVTAWSRETGVNRRTIARRLARGWSLEKVFSLHNFNFKEV